MQVTDIITPLIAAIWGGPFFGDLYFTINHSKFLYGDFLNQVRTCPTATCVLILTHHNSILEGVHEQASDQNNCYPVCQLQMSRYLYCVRSGHVLFILTSCTGAVRMVMQCLQSGSLKTFRHCVKKVSALFCVRHRSSPSWSSVSSSTSSSSSP